MLKLVLPVVLSYLGVMAMGLVDLMAVGRVSASAVGAVGVGTSIFAWFMIFGIGLLTSLDFLVARDFGAGDLEKCRVWLAQAVLLILGAAIPANAALVAVADHLPALGINPVIIPEAAAYLRVLSFSLIPVLLFVVFRLYLQAMGYVNWALIVLLVANVLNAAGNYAFVFGHWGVDAHGVVGSAWSTLVSRIFSATAMGGAVWMHEGRPALARMRERLRYSRERMSELLRLGMPSALQMTLEVGAFATATTIAARLSSLDIAAHQIVLNIASFTFMVPLGIGSASAVLIGQAVGGGRYQEGISRGWHGLMLGCGFMTFSAVVLLLFPRAILGLYTQDPSILNVAKSLILIAGIFQLFDGAQVVATGILRGLGNTRAAALANLFGHWMIGLPIGVILCFQTRLGIRGIWVGLSTGLFSVAAFLVFRWAIESNRMKTLVSD